MSEVDSSSITPDASIPAFLSPLHRALIERSREGILIVGNDGRIAAANAVAGRILHYGNGQLLGLKLEEVMDLPGPRPAMGFSTTPTRVSCYTKHRNMVPCEVRLAGEHDGYMQLVFEASKLTHADEALHALTVGTAAAVGDDFIYSLARHTALVLGYRYALVGELVPAQDPFVRTLAMWDNDSFQEPIEYELRCTPCEQAIRSGPCFFPRDVARLFPEDMWLVEAGAESYLGMPILNANGDAVGIIAAIHTMPKAPADDMRPVLSIFAARAAAEFERKRVETALRESELRYRRLIEDNPFGIILHSDYIISYANEAAMRMVGAPAATDVAGMPILQFVHPDLQEITRERLERQYRFGETQPLLQQKVVRLDGQIIDVEVRGIPILMEGMHVVQTVMRDMSDQRRAEEAQLRLTAAIEQAAEAILITDSSGSIVYVNPAFERITGYSHEEAFGNTPKFLQSGRHDAAFYAELWQTIRSGDIWSGRFVNRKKDGTLYQEDATISPVRDTSGQIVNYVAVKRDITQVVALETQLRQAQKMEAVGQLAGGIAHDFNNLLQAIVAHATLGMDLVPENGAARADFDQIRNAAVSAASLTRQLLAFSRRQVLQAQDLNLNDVIETVLKMIRRVIGEQIELEFMPEPEIGTVHVDPHQLEQVLMNLCVNSRDAMPEGGIIRMETHNVVLDEDFRAAHPWSRAGDYVVMAVTDNGTGMDEETLGRVFEPFFTTKGIGRGTGLGLATVYGIVKQHNGLVHVYSELNRGTTFKVYLPRVGRASKPLRSAASVAMASGNELVLLAEDEEMVRNATARVLERSGYRVLAASDGMEALALFQHHPDDVALVLLDLAMPKLGGIETAKRLRELRPGLRVLFCSGYGAAGLERLSDKDSMDLIEKPYTPTTLLSKIRQILDRQSPPVPK